MEIKVFPSICFELLGGPNYVLVLFLSPTTENIVFRPLGQGQQLSESGWDHAPNV